MKHLGFVKKFGHAYDQVMKYDHFKPNTYLHLGSNTFLKLHQPVVTQKKKKNQLIMQLQAHSQIFNT